MMDEMPENIKTLQNLSQKIQHAGAGFLKKSRLFNRLFKMFKPFGLFFQLYENNYKKYKTCQQAYRFLHRVMSPKQNMSLVFETNQQLVFEKGGYYSKQEAARASYSALLDKQIIGICQVGTQGLLPLEEIAQLLTEEEEALVAEKKAFEKAILLLKEQGVVVNEEIEDTLNHTDTLGLFSFKSHLNVIAVKRDEIFNTGFSDNHILTGLLENVLTKN